MANGEKPAKKEKQNKSERAWRLLRNASFLGGAALAGVALAVPGAALGAGLAVAGGVGFELAREHAAKRRERKKDSKEK